MTAKTEAQRLADKLEHQFPPGTAQHYLDGEAAAELLKLEAANAELLEALRHIHGVALANEWRDLPGISQTAGEAVKKHGGIA